MSQVHISPITTAAPHRVRFQGAEVNALLKQASVGQRMLGSMVKMRESTHGLSHLTFIQDTLVALLPKTLLSRSKAEFSEASFLEVLESLLIYYGVPLAGGKLFKNLSTRMAQQKGNAEFSKHLSTPLSKLSKALPESQLARIMATKASIIMGTLGLLIFGGEYVVHYTKNILTSKVFKKERFSDVINLSQGEKPENQTQSQVTQKSKKRIIQSLSLSMGLVAAALTLARFGGRAKLLQKPLEKFVKALDFDFSAKGAYRLSRGQMMLFMGLSIGAYLDASRDKLERVETASRLGLVMSYLIFGQDILEKLLIKTVSKKHKNLLENGRMKSLETLGKEAMERAKASFTDEVDQQTLLKKAAQEMKTPLRVKNLMFIIPLTVGIFGTGFGIGLMNRLWTAARFRQQEQEKAQKADALKRSIVTPLPAAQIGTTTQNPLSATAPTQPAFTTMPTAPVPAALPSYFPAALPAQSQLTQPTPIFSRQNSFAAQ